MPKTYSDSFPRKQEYERKTYDGRKVIGFKGYEMVEQSDGSWNLICTPGGHDAPHSKAEQA